MKRKELNTYLQQRFKAINKNLKQFISGGDQEDLHDFRVETKKVKAALSLLKYISGSKKTLKIFRPVEKIFDHGGKIRNAHIETEFAKRYLPNEKELKKDRKKLIEEEIEKLKKRKNKYLAEIKKAEEKIISRTMTLEKKDLADYTRAQVKELGKRLASTDKDQYHKARIILKKLVSNYVCCKKEIRDEVKLDLDYLEDIQNTIGEWHDLTLTIDRLSGEVKLPAAKLNLLKKKETKHLTHLKTLSRNFSKKVTAAQ